MDQQTTCSILIVLVGFVGIWLGTLALRSGPVRALELLAYAFTCLAVSLCIEWL